MLEAFIKRKAVYQAELDIRLSYILCRSWGAKTSVSLT
ncbi:hypothetical protein HMPREF1323_1636 [Porphyromonas sp. oral taxon 279 str. F0450]|nr:hypothetical protein HMPREF1323_1636 [Porphyromonas sp. oral taxon 279 str. F0450]